MAKMAFQLEFLLLSALCASYVRPCTSLGIDCNLMVTPSNGFMPIADDRLTLSVTVTCLKVLSNTEGSTPMWIASHHQKPKSFWLISEELSLHAFSKDTSVVDVVPKYKANRSVLATDSAHQLSLYSKLNIHVLQIRPDSSQSVRWCAFPRNIGRTNIIFTLRRFVVNGNETIFGKIVAQRKYLAKVCRNFRIKDMVFRGTVTIATVIIATGLGCGVDVDSIVDIVRMREPSILNSQGLLAALIHTVFRAILIPGMILGFGLLFRLAHTSLAGLLLWATISGGGISYILTAAIDGNEPLAIFLELISAAVGIVFTPFWIYVGSLAMMNLFDDGSDALVAVGWLYLWMIALNIPILIGIAVREYFPLLAHIFISWILRPSMLLFFILFITLGIYSNLSIVFEITPVDVVSLGIVIIFALSCAALIARFLGWEEDIAKALCSHQCCSNILLTLSLCRLALRAPERDALTKTSFLALFYSPMPFLLIKTCMVVKTQLHNLYARQHQQQMSIASGLADAVRLTLANSAYLTGSISCGKALPATVRKASCKENTEISDL